jgi:hypothetical protein
MHPVSVVLDFVQPLRPLWRFFHELRPAEPPRVKNALPAAPCRQREHVTAPARRGSRHRHQARQPQLPSDRDHSVPQDRDLMAVSYAPIVAVRPRQIELVKPTLNVGARGLTPPVGQPGAGR